MLPPENISPLTMSNRRRQPRTTSRRAVFTLYARRESAVKRDLEGVRARRREEGARRAHHLTLAPSSDTSTSNSTLSPTTVWTSSSSLVMVTGGSGDTDHRKTFRGAELSHRRRANRRTETELEDGGRRINAAAGSRADGSFCST